MSLIESAVLIVLILSSAATMQAALQAWINRPRRGTKAERTLARRFARGGLTEDEYTDALAVLRDVTGDRHALEASPPLQQW